MLHEKPRPIYIRAGISQWSQTVFEDGCAIFILSFEVFTRFKRDFANHCYLFNNYNFEWKSCENQIRIHKKFDPTVYAMCTQ